MCTPCSPGDASWTVTSTTTPEAEGVTRAVPVTLLPLFGSRVATATETGPPSAGPGEAAAPAPPSAAPGPESGLLHPRSLASAGSLVPTAGEPDEDEVAHPQARTTRSVAKRIYGPPANRAPKLPASTPLSTPQLGNVRHPAEHPFRAPACESGAVSFPRRSSGGTNANACPLEPPDRAGTLWPRSGLAVSRATRTKNGGAHDQDRNRRFGVGSRRLWIVQPRNTLQGDDERRERARRCHLQWHRHRRLHRRWRHRELHGHLYRPQRQRQSRAHARRASWSKRQPDRDVQRAKGHIWQLQWLLHCRERGGRQHN